MTAEKMLKKLVSINSVFPNEERLGLFVNNYLESIGFRTRISKVQEGRLNVFAESGTREKPILFYGHLDTVPVYGDWKSDPFKLKRVGDKLYGLGACDMKGGIAAILESVREQSDRRIKLLFCVDEENISRGAWYAVSENKSWFDDVSLIISADPAISDKSPGGPNTITAGRRGRTVISIEIKGLSSHGAVSERGISAIDEAAKIIVNLRNFDLRKHPKLGKESLFVKEISSSATSLSIPDKARMELDIQLVPPSTVGDAKARVEKLLRTLSQRYVLNHKTNMTVSIKKRDTPYIEPFATDLNNPLVKKVFKIVKTNLGKPGTNYGSSVADDNVFSNVLKTPVISIGATGGNEHTANEWVSRESLEQLTSLYKLLIERL